MNLSAHSNILGNIVNALEMILNNPRAVNFICQCFQGKNWSIPYLAVCGLMVIPELIWGRCTYMIFMKFSQNVYMGISFEKMRKKLGVTMLVKEWQTQMLAAVTIEKNRKSHEKVWCEGSEFVSTLKHPGKLQQLLTAPAGLCQKFWHKPAGAVRSCCNNEFPARSIADPGKHYHSTRNDFESSESYTFYMTMLSRQNMVNTIFGCMWQKCHTLANLGWMYLCDFYTIFRKCYFEHTYFQKLWQKLGVTRFV